MHSYPHHMSRKPIIYEALAFSRPVISPSNIIDLQIFSIPTYISRIVFLVFWFFCGYYSIKSTDCSWIYVFSLSKSCLEIIIWTYTYIHHMDIYTLSEQDVKTTFKNNFTIRSPTACSNKGFVPTPCFRRFYSQHFSCECNLRFCCRTFICSIASDYIKNYMYVK